ncbi:MAG: hypothetical protein V4701_06340 [Pseudomonadota bacterium]
MAAVGALALLMTASANGQDSLSAAMDAVPDGMFPLPVLATRAAVSTGERLSVCLYHGARPRELMVLHQTCWSGEDHCTVMVAVPRTDPAAFKEFNAANPPVVTAPDGQCERPYRAPIVGTLQAPR